MKYPLRILISALRVEREQLWFEGLRIRKRKAIVARHKLNISELEEAIKKLKE